MERRLSSDLVAHADSLRADDTFADELHCALCNSDWQHDDGSEGSGSWRHSAGVVAELRELGERYLGFYCSASGAEQTISERVATAMAELGWHGTECHLWPIDFRTGERKVWLGGEWREPEDLATEGE